MPDGSVPVKVTASAQGYGPAEATVTVLDSDVPSLFLVLTTTSATEGDVLTATVETNTVPQNDVSITFVSPSYWQVTLPETITIPAGQQSVTFTIPVEDDAYAETEELVTLSARANGYENGDASLLVYDNDQSALSLTLSSTAITEADGPMAILATVRRTQVNDRILRVQLSLDKPGQARVPSEVVILPGAAETTFYISPVVDGIADGQQTVTLTARRRDRIVRMCVYVCQSRVCDPVVHR